LRDAATIFDENAALVLTSDPGLATAIREHDWQELFVDRRKAFHDCIEVRLFGHALMEKLVSPYKAITAHAWMLQVDPGILSMPEEEKLVYLDAVVTAQLQEALDTSAFTPLPVLGIPGWQEGQDPDFYADNKVFRAKRQR
jgi:hypothetical protein